jgi:hypothetical protein
MAVESNGLHCSGINRVVLVSGPLFDMEFFGSIVPR